MSLVIRSILEKDNQAIKDIVQDVLREFGCVGSGFASGDRELDDMFSAYQKEGAHYYVVEDSKNKEILGGGGFAPLFGSLSNERICELRKVYLLEAARGKGLGKSLIEKVFTASKKDGYQEIYLETVDKLIGAVSLYEKMGFKKLEFHKGNTGHQHACTIYMNKTLRAD